MYQSMNMDVFMCNDFKKACEKGDCELFNKDCK